MVLVCTTSLDCRRTAPRSPEISPSSFFHDPPSLSAKLTVEQTVAPNPLVVTQMHLGLLRQRIGLPPVTAIVAPET